MAPPHHEPTVRVSAPMPRGYTFVPKGNVYITAHCRRGAQAAGETVYVVLGAGSAAALGIRVPAAVYERARRCHEATRDRRARAARRRDAKLEADLRGALLASFPRAPAASLAAVAARATRKGSGRVGRTGTLGLAERAALAVRAHVRHAHTDYDRLMREEGASREKARRMTYAKIDEVVRQWGGESGGGRRHGTQQAQRTKSPATPRSDEVASTAKGNDAGARTRRSRNPGPVPSTQSRRETKQTVRRTRAAAEVKSQSPEVQGGLARRTRGGLGASLREDGDSESDEYEWSSWDGSSDEESEYNDED